MSYTTVTITDTAKDPSGQPIPYAVITAYPRFGFANAGTTTNGKSAIAASDGTFTLALNATDDSGTAAVDPGVGTPTCAYHLLVIDPRTGEHVYDAHVILAHATSTPTLAQLTTVT